MYPYHKEILGTLKALSAVVVAAFAVKLQWAFCVAPKCRSLSLCGWNTLLKRIFSFSAKVPLAVVLRLDLFFRAPKNCRIPYISTKIGIGILRRPNLGKKKSPKPGSCWRFASSRRRVSLRTSGAVNLKPGRVSGRYVPRSNRIP